MPDVPEERFINAVDWPIAVERDDEPVDHHLGPLDRDEDRRWLRDDDPRKRAQP